jgi:hypothetical protein
MLRVQEHRSDILQIRQLPHLTINDVYSFADELWRHTKSAQEDSWFSTASWWFHPPTSLQNTRTLEAFSRPPRRGTRICEETKRQEETMRHSLVALDCRWKHSSPTSVWLIDSKCTTPISCFAIPASVLLHSLHIMSIGSNSFGWRVIRNAKPCCLGADEPLSSLDSHLICSSVDDH